MSKSKEPQIEIKIAKLDYDKMVEFVQNNHPRKVDPIDEKLVKYKICKTRTGSHPFLCLCKCTRAKSEFNKYGVGIALYYKAMKYWAFTFLLLTIFSIPAMMFYMSNDEALEDDGINGINTARNYLSQTTLGNLGDGSKFCTSGNLNDDITIFCNIGEIYTIDIFGVGTKSSDCSNNGEDLIVSSTCNMHEMFSDDVENIANYFENCIGEQNCSVTLTSEMFSDTCLTEANNNEIYIRAICKSTIFELGWFDKTMKKSDLAIIIVCLDVGCMYIFVLCSLMLSKYEKNDIKKILQKSLNISSFTLEIDNIPPEKNLERFRNALWIHIEKIIRNEPGIFDDYHDKIGIFNIELGLSSTKLLNFMLQIQKIDKQMEMKIRKMSRNDQWNNKTIKKLERKKKKIQLKLRNIEEKNKAGYPVKAFVTFQNMESFFRAKNAFHYGFWDSVNCCQSKRTHAKKLDENLLYGKQAPEPTKTKCEKRSRSCFVFFISLVLMVATAAMIIIAKNIEKNYRDDFPTINCDVIEITAIDAKNDYFSDDPKGYLHCFCLKMFKSDKVAALDYEFPDNGGTLCNDWFTAYTTSNFVIIGSVLFVVFTNICLKSILRKISSFEGKHSYTEELYSSTWKMFIAQFINTALIIFLVNLNLEFVPDNDLILKGNFKDFSVEWYRVVGSTIILFMACSIFSPHLTNTCFYFIRGFSRCRDRGCSFNKRKTKKLAQDDYNKVYLGPDFLLEYRYSTLIANIFICLMYSSGIPILYPSLALATFLAYWVDKIFFLRYYKNPPQYDFFLARKVHSLLKYALLLHIFFGYWMYSNSNIMQYESDYEYEAIARDEISSYDKIHVLDTIDQPHTLIFSLASLLLIIIYILSIILRKFCPCIKNHDYFNLLAKDIDENYGIIQSLPYHALVSEYQNTLQLYKKHLEINVGLSNTLEQKLNTIKEYVIKVFFKNEEFDFQYDQTNSEIPKFIIEMKKFNELFGKRLKKARIESTLCSYHMKDNPKFGILLAEEATKKIKNDN